MNDTKSEFEDMDFEDDFYDELPVSCYVQIQGWMCKLANEHNLKLNELMIYAVIHSFSQDGISVYRGNKDYLRHWAFCSRASVFEKVKRLVEANLVGIEYVNYKGERFPTYFTFASRKAINLAKKRFYKKNMENQQSKNWTEPVQKLDSPIQKMDLTVQNLDSPRPEFRPNNNLNNNLKAAANLKKIIKDNLGSYSYSDQFIQELQKKFDSLNFDDERVGDYISFVTEKVKYKKPNNINALFKTLVMAEDVLEEFLQKLSEKMTIKKNFCPVCGTENPEKNLRCCKCDFSFADSYDLKFIKKAKRIFQMPKAVQKAMNDEIDRVYKEYPVEDSFDLMKIRLRNEKISGIEKSYGVFV